MKRQNESTLSDMLKQFACQPKISTKLKKVKIEDAWLQIMGPQVNQYTSAIHLYKKKLIISITSSPLRQDLFMSRDKIKDKVNAFMSEEIVDIVEVR